MAVVGGACVEVDVFASLVGPITPVGTCVMLLVLLFRGEVPLTIEVPFESSAKPTDGGEARKTEYTFFKNEAPTCSCQ